MSSAASVMFDSDTVGVPAAEWQSFCEEHRIEHSPRTGGGNVYYAGEVEVSYVVHGLSFSTYWGGRAIPDVARLAMLAWLRWGGQLSADPEIRAVYVSPDQIGRQTAQKTPVHSSVAVLCDALTPLSDEERACVLVGVAVSLGLPTGKDRP